MLNYASSTSVGMTTMDMFNDIPPLGGTPFGAVFGNLCLLETLQFLRADLAEKSSLLTELQKSGDTSARPFKQELVFMAEVTKTELGSFYDLHAFWSHVDPAILNSKDILEFKELTKIDSKQDWYYSDRLWFSMGSEGPDFFAQYIGTHQPNFAVCTHAPILQIKGIKLKSNVIVEMRLVKNN